MVGGWQSLIIRNVYYGTLQTFYTMNILVMRIVNVICLI